MKRLISSLLTLILAVAAFAQGVSVMVTPKQQILPPQVVNYMVQPDKYFNISITNLTDQPQDCYLSISIAQVSPDNSCSISVPDNFEPARPIVVPARNTKMLDQNEVRHLFDHVPLNQIRASQNLLDDLGNVQLGMLPEGWYEGQVIAFAWDGRSGDSPTMLSASNGGKFRFQVAYNAPAPRFLVPNVDFGIDAWKQVCKIDPKNPLFTWTAPVIGANPTVQFEYGVKIVHVLKGQQPETAIQNNTPFYQTVIPLTSPMFYIPATLLNQIERDNTYVIQVKARVRGVRSDYMNYAEVENDGLSDLRVFTIPSDKPKAEEEGEKEKEEEPKEGEEYWANLSGESGTGIDPECLYTFKMPKLIDPTWPTDEVRKSFVGDRISVSWHKPDFMGGLANRPDTLKFKYEVSLYAAEEYVEGQEALFKFFEANKPVYQKETTELTDTIPYDKYSDKVTPGNYMIVYVKPVCENEKNIAMRDSMLSVKDWALCKHISRSYFKCSNSVEINNTTPTTKSLKELKGLTVMLGEYELTIDEIEKGSKKDRYKGKGHVEWKPLGSSIHIAVKFDDLAINTDDRVFEGEAKSYPSEENKMSVAEVIDEIFTDTSIDEWANSSSLPYASQLTSTAKKGLASVAEKYDIGKYYGYLKKGKGVWDFLGSGEIKDAHTPLQIPKDINKSPVDIQIGNMTFAATHATMNLIGEFTMPESNYTKNEVLLLGAPRVCISPNRVFPESGTIALMGNFTLTDPESQFEFTFKAPEDMLEPDNGCYVAWHDDKFEIFEIDVEMKIPDLKKVGDDGKATDELPTLAFNASLGSDGWEDFCIEGSMDAFTHEDTEGWVFKPGTIGYDHSLYRSGNNAPSLPKNYDYKKAGMESASSNSQEWMGLYMKDLKLVFPKMLKLTDKEDEKNFEGHLTLSLKEMLVDQSGVSMQLEARNVLELGTGKLGGWGLSVDNVALNVLQNQFKQFKFGGQIETPLEGLLGYSCNVRAQGRNGQENKDYSYIFKVDQVDSLSFDFWLGKMDFAKGQSHFLIEADSKADTEKTDVRVELCLGGDLSILNNSETRDKNGVAKSKALIDFELPQIHISGMRIANCPRKSMTSDESKLDKDTKGGKNIMTLLGIKEEYVFGEDNSEGVSEEDKKGSFYFSIGRWSLASLSKKLGPFTFAIDNYSFGYKNKKAELTVKGKIALETGKKEKDGTESGLLSASTELKFLANVDLKKFNFEFDKVEFRELAFDCAMASIAISGKLKAYDDTENGSGYIGDLSIRLPGNLISINADAGYFNYKSGKESYGWGYANVKVEATTGIAIPPIEIRGIIGGFYFNCKDPNPGNIHAGTFKSGDLKYTRKKGCFGGRLGLVLGVTGSGNTMRAVLDMAVIYDAEEKRLSSFVFDGKLEAFGGKSKSSTGATDDPLISANVQLVYENTGKDNIFQLTVTANGGKDLDNYTSKTLKEFSNKAFKEGKDVQQSLAKLTQEDAKSSGAQNKGEAETFKAKASAQVSIELKVTMPTQTYNKATGKATSEGKTRWHLYVGQPEPIKSRCSITLLDFQVNGGKNGKSNWRMWAYLGANAYLCMGNELPNNGKMPEIDPDVKQYLDGNDINDQKQTLSDDVEREWTTKKIDMTAKGGVMFGAAAKGDFGLYAGIVYAEGGFSLGFDLSVTHNPNAKQCSGSKGPKGYKGWYGEGQIYAMLRGEMGVFIDFWFFEGKVPIVKTALAALVRAGMPNPTWVLGSARASLSLFGGIIELDHTFEFKAGNVCINEYDDPLANFKFVADVQPAKDSKNVSCYATPRFTTNAQVGKEFRLVDMNRVEEMRQSKTYSGWVDADLKKRAERTYKFVMSSSDIKLCKVTGSGRNAKRSYKSVNLVKVNGSDTNYELECDPFDENSKYELTITAYGKEKNVKTGAFVTAYVDGKVAKEDTTIVFNTGTKSPSVRDHVAYAMPTADYKGAMRLSDATRPFVCLDDREKNFTKKLKEKVYYRWVVKKNGKRIHTEANKSLNGDDIEKKQGKAYSTSWKKSDYDYETFTPANALPISSSGTYTVQLVSYKPGTSSSNKIKQKVETKKAVQVSNKGSKDRNATNAYSSQMNKFLQDEEAKRKKDSQKVTTTDKFVDPIAVRDDEVVMYEFTCTSTDNEKFYTDTKSFARPYENVYMAVHEYDNPYMERTVNQVDGTYWNNMGKVSHKVDPYRILAYYNYHAFMGGVNVGKYAFSDIPYNNIQGFNATLDKAILRRQSVYRGDFDDAAKTYHNRAERFDYAPLPSGADGKGIGWQYNPDGVSSHWTQYKIPSGVKDINQTQLFKDVKLALANDAVGVQFLTYKMRTESKVIIDRIRKERKEHNISTLNFINDVTDFNDKYYAKKMVSYSSYSYRLLAKSGSNFDCYSFRFSFPYAHFFQMANMGGYPAKTAITEHRIQNFEKNYKNRYNHKVRAWENVYDASYDALQFLKGFNSITFVMYSPDRWLINKKKPATGKDFESYGRKLRTVKVNKPFDNYRSAGMK